MAESVLEAIKNVGSDPLGPLMRVRADQVLAAIRVEELTWEEIMGRSGLNVGTMENVIPWMRARGEIEMIDQTDGNGLYWATWRLPDDRRLAYALEMARGA